MLHAIRAIVVFAVLCGATATAAAPRLNAAQYQFMQALRDGQLQKARDLLEHPSVKDLAAYATNRNGSERRGPSRPSLRDFRNGARRAPVQGSTATAAPRDGR